MHWPDLFEFFQISLVILLKILLPMLIKIIIPNQLTRNQTQFRNYVCGKTLACEHYADDIQDLCNVYGPLPFEVVKIIYLMTDAGKCAHCNQYEIWRCTKGLNGFCEGVRWIQCCKCEGFVCEEITCWYWDTSRRWFVCKSCELQNKNRKDGPKPFLYYC